MHARLLIADSLEVRRAGALPWLVMLRQAARSSRLLRLCQAATALRLAPCIAAEPGAGPDLTVRAFGAVTQPFAMCDVSKAPPKHHAAPSVKPANPPRSALGQDAKKRAYTTLEEDGVDGVLYPETTAKIGRPAPDFSTEGTVYHPIRRFVHFIFPILSLQTGLPRAQSAYSTPDVPRKKCLSRAKDGAALLLDCLFTIHVMQLLWTVISQPCLWQTTRASECTRSTSVSSGIVRADATFDKWQLSLRCGCLV